MQVQERTATAGPWEQFSNLQRWSFLAVLFLVGTSSAMDRAIISIVLEQLKHEFALSDSALGLIGGAPFGVCYALSSIPLARLADRYGRKRILFASALGWTIMTVLCGLAVTLPFLVLARMGVGAAEGGSVAPSHALIADYFRPDRRGLALAIFTASGTLGTLIATSLGGIITETYGWRMAFIGMAALSLPVVLLILGVLREPRRSDAEIALSQKARPSFREDLGALFRKRTYIAILLGLFCYSALPYGVIIFTPTFMVRSLGLDIAQAGTLFGVGIAIGVTIGSLVGGQICDMLRRRDEKWLLALPAVILAVDAPIAIGAYSATNLTVFMVLHALNTAMLYAAIPSIFAAVQHVCGGGRRATATATAALMINAVGVAMAPLLTGALSDAFEPWAGADSLRYAILATCAFLVPGALALFYGSRHVAADGEE